MFIFAKKLRHEAFSRILIIAPHPDDEVIGCGGLISKLVSERKEVNVLFMTSGEMAHVACCDISSDYIAAKRRSDAYKACAIIGVPQSNIYFINQPDGLIPNINIKLDDNDFNQLCSIIDSCAPDNIFCPHPLDIMPDHISTSELIKSVLLKIESNATIYYYCTWFWIYAPVYLTLRLNWFRSSYVDISDVAVNKSLAMKAYFDFNDLAPCGDPWPSKCPDKLFKATTYKKELYFTGLSKEVFSSCWTHYERYL